MRISDWSSDVCSSDLITPKNVAGLTPVWTYSFGDAEPYNLQIAPLKIGGLVYACNSTNVVVALDAASGKQVWRFDPKPDLRSAPFRADRKSTRLNSSH